MYKFNANKSVLLINMFIALLALTTACADPSQDLDDQNQLKHHEYDSYDEYNYDESSTDDSIWVQTDGDSRADNSSDNSWEYSQEETAAVHHTGSTSASLGGSCAPGCIWSSYAVQMGAQSAEATCGSSSCACVVEGDIWSSCSASSNSSSQPSNPTQPATSNPNYNASLGNQLADAAYRIAVARNTVGYCYNAAADAIESVVGRFLWGASAYMAADQLAAHSRFFEVSVSDLRSLPAGAVVVWGRGNSAHGHISIALGNGQEASDHVTSQMTYHYGGGRARIFYPR